MNIPKPSISELVRVVSPGWTLSLRSANVVTLIHSAPVSGWHRIEVQFIDRRSGLAQAVDMSRAAHMPAVSLLASADASRYELIFYSRQPLSTLQLAFHTPATTASSVQVTITPISRAAAIIGMMRYVSAADRRKNVQATRIYRKSWARWRRHGWDGFLSRLIREYQPQLVPWMQLEDPYQAWIEHVETPKLEATAHESVLAALTWRPRIDLILHYTDAPEQDLRATIESVLRQRYKEWALWVTTANLNNKLQQTVARYAENDDRIRLIHTAAPVEEDDSPDRFLGVVTGGDILPEHALLEIARYLQTDTNACVIYSDHDEIGENGARINPHFKPDWNPDLFFSQDYIGRMCLYRADLLRKADVTLVGGDDPSGRHVLFKCLPLLDGNQIAHIPQVLYHQRLTVARERTSEPQHDPGLLARQRYFAAVGAQRTTVEQGLLRGTYRVRYPIPAPAPMVSLLIPTRDKRELVETCVRSILDKTTYPNYEIIILDNQSSSFDTLTFFATIELEDKRVRTIRYDHPFNFSAINNFGVAHAKGEIIGLINNDIEVISPDWLTEMVSHVCRPEIGCVGAKLYYSNDTIQHGGVIIGLWGVAGHAHKHLDRYAPGYLGRAMCTQNFSAVTAACMLVRKEVFDLVGGLDEENLKVSFNDVDFCLKVREAGYRNLWTPYAELYHHESLSRGPEDTPEKKARERREIEYMKIRWGHRLSSDPCYSPNLTRHMENFSTNIDKLLFPNLATPQPGE